MSPRGLEGACPLLLLLLSLHVAGLPSDACTEAGSRAGPWLSPAEAGRVCLLSCPSCEDAPRFQRGWCVLSDAWQAVTALRNRCGSRGGARVRRTLHVAFTLHIRWSGRWHFCRGSLGEWWQVPVLILKPTEKKTSVPKT